MSPGGWIVLAARSAVVVAAVVFLILEVVAAWKEWRDDRRVARIVRDKIDRMRRHGL